MAAPAIWSVEGGVGMGAAVMLGTLIGLIVVIYALVRRYDPEARRPPTEGRRS